MAGELGEIQKEVQQQARNLSGAQPQASTRLREGLSAIQQNEAQQRMKDAAGWLRNGQGRYITNREAPVTQALDGLKDSLQRAQQALGGASQQQARNDTERQLQNIERLRAQLQNYTQRGQGDQNGQQQGNQSGQQPGQGNQSGQQNGNGQQPGQGNQGGAQGGQRNGAGPYGGPNGGYIGPNGGAYVGPYYNGTYDPRLGVNRQYPRGVYDVPDERNVPPGQVGREFQRQLQDLRQMYKDDPNVSKQIAEMQAELDKMQIGDIASPELAQRISRTILPQLETLEVQLRRDMEEKGTGQARSAASGKIPDGYGEAWSEYTRKLASGK